MNIQTKEVRLNIFLKILDENLKIKVKPLVFIKNE